MNDNRVTVYAVDADGKEKKIKAQALRLVMQDGSIMQVLLDDPDGLLIGTPADEDLPARLIIRPGAANAVRIAVEQDDSAFAELPAITEGSLDLEVQYIAKPKGVPSKKRLRRWVEAALERGLDASLTIRVVDEDEGRALNRDFRSKDYATNVLSFAFNEGEAMPGTDDVMVGDLVLCAPVIAREAEEQGKSVEAHWAHLIVHGVLHLQGYDHQDEVEAEAMESLETAILQSLGYDDPYISEKRAPDAE
ncbi:MAG: rRNA maturation RNase YbeY [Burkholderiales bacterium]|nr:rRNA maturation RNase YbeY [Burkholderiales bacterium]